jgi:hypothetical protein
MAYRDEWEREALDRFYRWRAMRWDREWTEGRLIPDERLDGVGWDIFYCATQR